MYYDDEARRFNFISGFLLGAALGSGVALMLRPLGGRVRIPGRRSRPGARGAALPGGRRLRTILAAS